MGIHPHPSLFGRGTSSTPHDDRLRRVPLASENGFRVTMLIGCGVGLAAAVVAALIPVRTAKAPPQPAAAAPDAPRPAAVKA